MARKSFKGSRDTSDKLSRLQQYLQQYAIALKEQGFARIYVDAFAGNGSRTETHAALPLFGLAEEEFDTPGSAHIALMIDPPFDTIALVEEDRDRFEELSALAAQFPDRRIVLRNGDANDTVCKICRGVPWHRKQGPINGMRGVVFLDPFGMEVDWSTVEAIAQTEALDCWYFFPLSGLYRNAPHEPKRLDAKKEASLDRVLGTPLWRQHWYTHSIRPKDILETEEAAVVRADVDAIEEYVGERLRSVFRGTVLPPRRLFYDSGAPLASLFFAVANPSPKAVGLATRIASHILRAEPGISS